MIQVELLYYIEQLNMGILVNFNSKCFRKPHCMEKRLVIEPWKAELVQWYSRKELCLCVFEIHYFVSQEIEDLL